MRPPLCSSDEIVAALRRAGFTPARRAVGSHQMFERVLADGSERNCVVVIGKREVARGSLASILRQAGMTVEEFMTYL